MAPPPCSRAQGKICWTWRYFSCVLPGHASYATAVCIYIFIRSKGGARKQTITSSSAVANTPRDASCLSVVSFNSTKRRVESFIVSYVGYRFITACSMRCSVVFGVALRLVINISSSSPAINTAAYYQRCVITCGTVAVLHWQPRLQHLPVPALTQAVKPDIGSESRFLPTPPAFDALIRGVTVGILLGTEKPEWRGYSWRWKNCDDMFIRFDATHERDRHTQRRTDRHRMTT